MQSHPPPVIASGGSPEAISQSPVLHFDLYLLLLSSNIVTGPLLGLWGRNNIELLVKYTRG